MKKLSIYLFIISLAIISCKKNNVQKSSTIPKLPEKPLTLQASARAIYTFQDVTLTASGGTGFYYWTVNGVETPQDSVFTTSFRQGGLYTIVVSSGSQSLTKKILVHPGVMSVTLSNQTGFNIKLPSIYLNYTNTNGEFPFVQNYGPLSNGGSEDTLFFTLSDTTNLTKILRVSGQIDNPIVTEASFVFSLPFDFNGARHHDIIFTPGTQATWTILSVSNGSPSYIQLSFSDASTYDLQKP